MYQPLFESLKELGYEVSSFMHQTKPLYFVEVTLTGEETIKLRLNHETNKLEVFFRNEFKKETFYRLKDVFENFVETTDLDALYFQTYNIKSYINEEMELPGYLSAKGILAKQMYAFKIMKRKGMTNIKFYKKNNVAEKLTKLTEVLDGIKEYLEEKGAYIKSRNVDGEIKYYYHGHHGHFNINQKDLEFEFYEQELDMNLDLENYQESIDDLLTRIDHRYRLDNIYNPPSFLTETAFRNYLLSAREVFSALSSIAKADQIEEESRKFMKNGTSVRIGDYYVHSFFGGYLLHSIGSKAEFFQTKDKVRSLLIEKTIDHQLDNFYQEEPVQS
jgi:hypothetical protein